jgi:hypothetical protein
MVRTPFLAYLVVPLVRTPYPVPPDRNVEMDSISRDVSGFQDRNVEMVSISRDVSGFQDRNVEMDSISRDVSGFQDRKVEMDSISRDVSALRVQATPVWGAGFPGLRIWRYYRAIGRSPACREVTR